MLNPVKNGKQLSVDSSGNLLVTGSFSVSGGNAAASTTAAAVPAQADYIGFSSGGNLVGVSSTNALPIQAATYGTVAPGTAATSSELTGGVVATSAPAGTAGQQVATQMDTAGNIRISPYGNSGAAQVVSVSGAGNTIISIGPAAGKKWYVFGGIIKVVTNATVANRQPNVNMQDASSNPTTSNYATVVTTASLTRFYSFGPGLPQAAAFLQDVCTFPIPNLLIPPLGKMFSSLFAGVAGDTFTMYLNILELAD